MPSDYFVYNIYIDMVTVYNIYIDMVTFSYIISICNPQYNIHLPRLSLCQFSIYLHFYFVLFFPSKKI